MTNGTGKTFTWLAKLSLLAVLLMVLSACGASQDSQENFQDSAGASDQQENGIYDPNVLTNVPPPQDPDILAETFFEKKEILDGFSEELQEQIRKNLNEAQDQGPKLELDFAADSDARANSPLTPFLTLFGNTLPVLATSDCDPVAEFLCLDEPLPPEGASAVYTIEGGLDVIGRVYLPDLAIFGPNDPAIVVAAYNFNTGTAPVEFPILASDLESTSDPEVARFHGGATFGGYGRYPVVVSAYKVANEGDTNELFSRMVEVFRTPEEIEIEFLEARPVIDGVASEETVEGNPSNGVITATEVISAQALQLTVRLVDTPFSPGIQVQFLNFDDEGRVRGYAAVGGVASEEASTQGDDIVYKGTPLLHQGKNTIKIRAVNPELQAALGDQAPEFMELTFIVENYYGRPRLKVISPDTAVVPPANGPLNFEFCYTVIPDRVADGTTTEVDLEKCSTVGLPPGQETCMFLNGRLVGEDESLGEHLDADPATGTYTARLHPDFGLNTYQIIISEDDCVSALYSSSGSFVYGDKKSLIQRGGANSNYWTDRGLQLDVDRTLFEGDVKTMLQAFLDREETKDMVMGIFKKTATTPSYTCTEFFDPNTGKPVVSNGDTTIEFLSDTFTLGPGDGSRAIEIERLTTTDNGLLELEATLYGLKGEADLKPIHGTGGTFNGLDLGFLPITVSIRELKVKLGIHLPYKIDLNGDGVYDVRGLDIKRIPGKELFDLKGGGPLGKVGWVNSARNPLASGLELLDWQSDLVNQLFRTTMGATLTCGIEEGMNHPDTGMLGAGAKDLEDILSRNDNVFRLPLENFGKELLGKFLDIDLAFDVLGAEIAIDHEGLHVRNAPLRVNPGPRLLRKIMNPEGNGIGMVTRPPMMGEEEPQQNLTNDNHKAALLLGEDALNMFLAAAVHSGIADLDIDAKFYKDLGIIPTPDIAPMGSKLAAKVDINRDGTVNEIDDFTPVRWSIRFNPRTPPMLTMLSDAQVKRLAEQEAMQGEAGGENGGDSSGDGGEPPATPPDDTTVKKAFFVPGEGVMRLSLPNMEIAAYKEEAIPASQGGRRTYCKHPWSDPPGFAAQGFCQLSSNLLVDDNEDPTDAPACAEEDQLTMVYDNGPVVSHYPPTAENEGVVGPLYKVKANLIAHVKVLGVQKETSAKAQLQAEINGEAPPEPKNVVHLKFAPSSISPEALVAAVEVLENNTNITDGQIRSLFDTVLTAALASNCTGVNELRIALPDHIPLGGQEEGDAAQAEEGDEEAEPSLIESLGLTGIDLGIESNQLPQVFIDENQLYLDLLVYAGLQFGEEEANE